MQDLFASGRAIDIIVAIMVVEAIALLAYRRTTGRGPSAAETLANLASGAMIMLAVRAALTGSDWTTTAAFLLAAFAAHLADLALRFRTRN